MSFSVSPGGIDPSYDAIFNHDGRLSSFYKTDNENEEKFIESADHHLDQQNVENTATISHTHQSYYRGG